MFKRWRFIKVLYQAPKTGRIILCDLDLKKVDLDLKSGNDFIFIQFDQSAAVMYGGPASENFPS